MKQEKRTELPERNLDVLRAAAVLAVVVFHLLWSRHHVATAWVGRVGVLAFFVHTALVLMASIERGGQTGRWMLGFYIRRICRIYPLALVTLALWLTLHIPTETILAGVTSSIPTFSSGAIVSNALLLENLFNVPDVVGVFWTLPLEVQMYATLPFCYLVARRSARAVLALIAAAIVLALVWPTISEAPLGLWRLTTLVQFVPCFLCGVFAYAARREWPALAVLPAWSFPLLVTAAAAAYAPVARTNLGAWRSAPMWGVCFVISLGVIAIRELPASRISRLARWIARYSYGFYLLHNLPIWIAFVLLAREPAALQWTVIVLGIPALAVLAYHLVEAPVIRIGSRVVARQLGRSLTVVRPEVAPAIESLP